LSSLDAVTHDDAARAANHDDNDDNNDDDDNDDHAKASLLETAAEYEAKRAATHPTTTHIHGDTSTGEENEITQFQVTIDDMQHRSYLTL
jgi:hypothetical protein